MNQQTDYWKLYKAGKHFCFGLISFLAQARKSRLDLSLTFLSLSLTHFFSVTSKLSVNLINILLERYFGAKNYKAEM